MAENLFLLKRRIKTANNIAQIAKAMEMISASKIKRAQTAVENHKPYAKRITTLTQNLLAKVDQEEFNHPYITPQEKGKTILIIISPDKGLCGSLNTNLFKKTTEIDTNNVMAVTIGKKAEWFASRLGFNLIASFPMGTSLPSFSLVYQLIKLIEPYVLSGEVTTLKTVYTEFESIFSQFANITTILPIRSEELLSPEQEAAADLPFIVEPSIQTLLESLLPYYVQTKLYATLLEAYTSEQAARMVAMQNAKNNASDVASFLTLTYNKRRQERITNELLDLANATNI